jgi:hypothetical protein
MEDMGNEYTHTWRMWAIPLPKDLSWGSRPWRWEVDGTGSGSCPVAGSAVSDVEPSGSTTKVS